MESHIEKRMAPKMVYFELALGYCIKFRDPSAAAVKYQGISGSSQGQFLGLPVDASHI